MKYIFSGFFIGFIFFTIPFFSGEKPFTAYPQWFSSIDKIHTTSITPNNQVKDGKFVLNTENALYHINTKGAVIFSKIFDQGVLHASSGNGDYYTTFEKLGDSISFFGKDGNIYWKHETPQYPYLSYSAQNVLLLIADLSGLFVLDFDSNPSGAKFIEGKFCSSIVFSSKSDYAGAGFLDGKFYILDEAGKLFFSGKVPTGNSVKSMALSPNGKFAAIHYGNTSEDGLLCIDLLNRKTISSKLKNCHSSKTGISITDDGVFAILDFDNLIVANTNDKELISINITPAIAGHSKIKNLENSFAITYPTENGATLLVFSRQGEVFFKKNFANERYMDLETNENSILVRGINNLYSWSFDGLSE